MPITSRSPLAQAVARAKEPKPVAPVEKPKAAKVKAPNPVKEAKPEEAFQISDPIVPQPPKPKKLNPVGGPYWTGARNFGGNIIRYATTLNLDATQIIELCRRAMEIESRWNAKKTIVKSIHDQAFEEAAIAMGFAAVAESY